MEMNKKADERILSIYLFIIYIVVSIGIVSGVLLVQGSGLDVRKVEAGILADKIIDCLVDQGNLNTAVLSEDFDLLSFCGVEFRSDDEEYGVNIVIEDIEKKYGRDDYLEFCNLKGTKIPKCETREVYVLNKGVGMVLKVEGVVGKINKNT